MRSTATFRALDRSPGIAPRLRRWTATVTFTVFCLAASSAWAISLRDIIELSRAGVSDDVLVELIAIDETVFHLSRADLLDLTAAGVSDRVVIAMLRTAGIERERREQAEAQARYEAAESARVAAATYGGSLDIACSNPSPRRESTTVEVPVPVAVPVPVPVVIQQVVEVDSGRSRRSEVGGHLPPPLSYGASPAASAGRGSDHDRRSDSEKKPYWVVKTSGWVVK